MPLIEVRGLTKLYRMGDTIVRALDGVDFAIERGEFVAITGPSGSGKSTIMHLLGCLDRPTAGNYHLAGRDVSRLSDRELAVVRNKQIGFVFQTFNLINRTSALDNVGVPLFYARRAATREPALRALERVGLTPRAAHQPNELSGGERQRVAIARAIVNDPVLLLADEPTGNLDTRTGAQIMHIVHALNEQGVTIIIVTHEQEIAEQAQRIVQMRDGRIVSDRRTQDILAGEGRARPRKLADLAAHAGAAALTAAPVGVAVADPPAAGLVPASAAAAPEANGRPNGIDLRSLPPRLVPGATAAFVLGLVTGALLAASLAILTWFQVRYSAQLKLLAGQPGKPSADLVRALLLASGAAGAYLIALITGIIAIVLAVRARRRMREEPANWQGRKRLWIGLLLGSVPAVLLGLIILANIVRLAL